MSVVAIAIAGCVAVLVVDAAGSLLSRRLEFPYHWLIPLSTAVYAATGYLAADAGGHFLAGAAAAAAVGATDATLGWRVSNAFGASEQVSEDLEIGVAAAVTSGAAVVGAIAGAFA